VHEAVQDIAVLVDSPPQVLLFSIDLDEDLTQVPCVTRPGLPAAQRACVPLPELAHQRRTVSYETTIPHSSMNSSTSRNDSGKRKYSHAQ
jgi:hypothetical protein